MDTGYYHYKMRAFYAEELARKCIEVNPMIKNLKLVKEARAEWGKYVDLHRQLQVWDNIP